MSKKKPKNYLDKIPAQSQKILNFTQADNSVTLEVENKGIMNRIAQRFFKKPHISYIRLDRIGSLVWLLIDGKKSIYDIAVIVENRFGNDAQPLYERLISFFKALENNGFIKWN